jgi:hypothetical protein
MFNISFGLLLVGLYFVIVYYVIPDFVKNEDKGMASDYTTYALTGLLAILGIGSLVADHLDESSIKSRRH